MAKKASGSAKRFGVRYGRKLREKTAAVEKEYKGKKKCPFCNNAQLRRVSVGIWNCSKCNSKFTGRAYSPKLQPKKI